MAGLTPLGIPADSSKHRAPTTPAIIRLDHTARRTVPSLLTATRRRLNVLPPTGLENFMRTPHPPFAFALVVAFLVSATTASAQRKSATLVGWIRDSSGTAVVGASVQADGGDVVARTDSAGRFRIASLDPGKTTFNVRRLGFTPHTFEVTLRPASVDSVAVTMAAAVALLDAIKANASARLQYQYIEDFYKRRAKGGGGFFVTRDDIEVHHSSLLSDALRFAPNVRITRPGSSRSGGGLRFNINNSKAYDCPPQIWVDGRRIRGAEVDDYPAGDVEAVELYAGPASVPSQFSLSLNTTCGTVLIWTRIPGAP
jgi:hypothetical protein